MTEEDLEKLEAAPPSFDLMKDRPVPFPGVPGAAIPERFTGAVRDPKNSCKAQLEVEIHDGRPRLRSFTVVAEGDPLTPTSLRRLPIGSYLDVVVSLAMLRSQQSPGGDTIIWPITDFDEALSITKAGKAARRRQPVTRERLAAVAAAYQEAPVGGKSEHVANQLGVEYGYARQLIHKARQKGLLPPLERKG